MSKSSCVNEPTSHHNTLFPCCGPMTPTTNNILSSGLTNSASEKPLSESSATSCPHISGVAADFWTWLDDPANLEWAISTFPVEKGYSDRNVFVSKLPPSFTDRDMQSMFENFGEVVSAKVMLNVTTGVSKETGFVQFATAKDALRARAFLRLRPALTEPPMPEVGTQWAQNKHDGGVYGDRSRLARKLFIRNIPVSVTNEEMRALVTRFGEVAEVTLHADTYDASAAAAAVRGSDNADGETMSSEVATPPPPKRTMRICFVTFTHPGVAAHACAAIHNTKPFRTCGDIPLMAKIAEDNNARQARHQQGLMHRSDIRHAATVAAAAAHSAMSTPSLSYGQRTSSANAGPMAAAGWYKYPQSHANMESMPNAGVANMIVQKAGYPQILSPVSSAFNMVQGQPYNGNWCAKQTPSPSNGSCGPNNSNKRSTSTSTSTSTSISNRNSNKSGGRGGMSRLTFQPHNPHANVNTLDPEALAASGTPRVLSTTASPSMDLPVAPNTLKSPTVGSRRSSRPMLLLSSATPNAKTRIPATTTSAPTSARRASLDMLGRSPLHSLTSDRAHTTSGNFSNSASSVHAAEQSSLMNAFTLPQEHQQRMKTAKSIHSVPHSSRGNSVSAIAAVAAVPAVIVSPRPGQALVLSSRSSDTANSRDSGSYENSAQSCLNVHVSSSRQRRSGQKFQQLHQPRRQHHSLSAASAVSTNVTQESLLTSPYMAPQSIHLQYGIPLPMMATAALAVGPTSLSGSRSGWDGASEEAIVSPYSSSAHVAGRNASIVTPTRMGNTSQTRYRNNPYGMSIVVERNWLTSFAEV